MRKSLLKIFLLLMLPGLLTCTENKKMLFSEVPSDETGITFRNDLVETAEKNVLSYIYFYNGGGVAAGDLDNDGLADLIFTGNQTGNKVYINKGNFSFEVKATRGASQQRTPVRQTDDEDVDDNLRDRAPPPPGMGKLVDRLV